MKANELRIGNLVTWDGNSNPIFTIEHITRDWGVMISHHESGGSLTTRIDIESVVPIPLTEEWLVKLGFEKTYESAFRLKYDLPCNFIGFDFSKTEDKSMDGLRFYGRYFKIKYVHQLQNLYFALTGEELVCLL